MNPDNDTETKLPPTDPLHPGYDRSPYRGAEASPIAVTIIRAAAIALLVAFFLPWGQAWIHTSCSSRTEGNTLGTLSGWDIATGDDLIVPERLGSGPHRATLEPQPLALLIPVIAVAIVVVPFLTHSPRLTRMAVYGVYSFTLLASVVAGFIVLHVVDNLSVPANQQRLLGPRDGYGELPRIELDVGMGWWLVLLSLTFIGIASTVGLALQGRASVNIARGDPTAVEGHEIRGGVPP